MRGIVFCFDDLKFLFYYVKKVVGIKEDYYDFIRVFKKLY